MIVDNSFNRKLIKKYLENISEDDLIDEVIIPIFAENNFYVFRRNIHGPGEHGTDIIFYRHVKMFLDNEYISVQAKAEKVVASNVSKFAGQINRAHKVPITGKSGASIYPNYVMFINSKIHTNDANFEMHYLTDIKVNTKILTQDQLVDLIMEYKIIAPSLDSKLEKYMESQTDSYDDDIRKIILSDDNKQINKLLDYDLRIDSKNLSNGVKELIVNYIFHKWDEDGSWEGTAKPMEWLNYYFSYIQPGQYRKLLKVFQEYVASYPSKKAKTDTYQVVRKITPAQINEFKDGFIKVLVEQVYSRREKLVDYNVLVEKFNELYAAKYLTDDYETIGQKTNRAIKLITMISKADEEDEEALRKEYKAIRSDLYDFLYPDEKD